MLVKLLHRQDVKAAGRRVSAPRTTALAPQLQCMRYATAPFEVLLQGRCLYQAAGPEFERGARDTCY